MRCAFVCFDLERDIRSMFPLRAVDAGDDHALRNSPISLKKQKETKKPQLGLRRLPNPTEGVLAMDWCPDIQI